MSGSETIMRLRTESSTIPESPLIDAVYAWQLGHGQTDAEMGSILGMGRTHYCQFRNGKRPRITHQVAERMYRVMKLPADVIFDPRHL